MSYGQAEGTRPLITLEKMRKGERGIIKYLPGVELRARALRLGLATGDRVECLSVLPGGPVVIEVRGQEVAVGRNLARRILISPL